MGLNVFWTRLAENKLEDIYQYYRKKAGVKIAKNLIIGIIDSTSDLKISPFIGQVEPELINRPQDFRYLVFKNYKVIYWINESKRTIEIANVFDCRQNPTKISETK